MPYNIRLVCSIFIISMVIANYVAARPLPNEKQIYQLRIFEQNLTDVLQQFGNNIGVQSVISKDISGRVINYGQRYNRCKFVVELGKKFGFDYYFDGKKVHFFRNYEKISETLQLKERPARFIIKKLKQFGVWEKRFTEKSYLRHKLLQIYAPKAYLDDIKHHIKLIEQGDSKPFHQFRGKSSAKEDASISPALSFEN